MKRTLISIVAVWAICLTAIAGDNPKVDLDTSKGKIVLELNSEKAPQTVKNFLAYVDAGHYNGTIFHRVIPDFMIQGGGFSANMKQKRTQPPIRNEADNGLRNQRGTIAIQKRNEATGIAVIFARLHHHKNTVAFFAFSVEIIRANIESSNRCAHRSGDTPH